MHRHFSIFLVVHENESKYPVPLAAGVADKHVLLLPHGPSQTEEV